MNGVDTLRSAFQAAYMWYDGTVANVTEQQANYRPAGKAHSIATLATHVQQSEDWFVNQLMRGGEMKWEAEGWGDKLGIPNLAQLQDNVEVQMAGGLQRLQPFQEAIRANTAEYFNGLTDADLDEELDMSAFELGMMRRGDVISNFLLGNSFAHTGEISAIKGIQGVQGYPF